jgi:hypothetical protein
VRKASGFSSDAADKIWNDHLGNNAFVEHRDRCAMCLAAFRTRQPGQEAALCRDGARIFNEMLDEVYAKIDEVTANQN